MNRHQLIDDLSKYNDPPHRKIVRILENLDDHAVLMLSAGTPVKVERLSGDELREMFREDLEDYLVKEDSLDGHGIIRLPDLTWGAEYAVWSVRGGTVKVEWTSVFANLENFPGIFRNVR